MARIRFQQILAYLHFNGNSLLTKENKDNLYKLRPFIYTLNQQFESHYYGTKTLSVDESAIKFKEFIRLKWIC